MLPQFLELYFQFYKTINFKHNIEFDLYKLNKIVFSSDDDFNHFQRCYEESYKVEQFCNSVSINLKGEYDFIINNVKKKRYRRNYLR